MLLGCRWHLSQDSGDNPWSLSRHTFIIIIIKHHTIYHQSIVYTHSIHGISLWIQRHRTIMELSLFISSMFRKQIWDVKKSIRSGSSQRHHVTWTRRGAAWQVLQISTLHVLQCSTGYCRLVLWHNIVTMTPSFIGVLHKKILFQGSKLDYLGQLTSSWNGS